MTNAAKKKVDDCLDTVNHSESINTEGDVITRLNGCAKIVDTERANLTQPELNELIKKARSIKENKVARIKQIHEGKGQGYYANPPHISSGQRKLYGALKKQ